MIYRQMIVDLPEHVTPEQYRLLLLTLEAMGVSTFKTPFGDSLKAAKLQIFDDGRITGAQG